jgi:subtilase family serine protease
MGSGGRRIIRRAAVAAACLLAVPVGAAVASGATAPAARSSAAEAGVGSWAAGCSRASGPLTARCYLSVEHVSPANQAVTKNAKTCLVSKSAGWSACNIENAYAVTKAAKSDGSGNLVAIVDAYDDPSAETDLATYRSTNHLPACTTANGCFAKVNQLGQAANYPGADAGWASEISIDLQMVSAVCPLCHILLVEANSSGFNDLATAENEAVTLGAHVISNSWGNGEFDGETSYDNNWDHPGVDVTFSSGDGAYQGGVQYPSASPFVTSVGGTQLKPKSNTRGWKETAWVGGGSPPTQGSGSGCSSYEAKPTWQHDPSCSNRMTADVSAVAANVKFYDSYKEGGWLYGFGTSVSSPIIAGMYGLADNQPTYTVAASAAYGAPAGDLYDITKGADGTCTPTYFCQAGPGYDGPTGLGTPNGIGAFEVPVTSPPTINSVSFTGTASDPTVTISGSNFGTEPGGSPAGCSTTGDNFPGTSLTFNDTTGSWGAGTGGDCIGLVVSSYSSTQVVYQFGSGYNVYGTANGGDSFNLTVQGATYSGTVTYS